MYIIIAVAIFVQCANVYVMYFAETGPRIIPHIRSRLTPNEEEQREESEAPEHISCWLRMVRALNACGDTFFHTIENNQTVEYVITSACFSLSYLILGSMFVCAVALFCLGMRYYNASIGTRAVVAALYL